jgi:hypothetical protein
MPSLNGTEHASFFSTDISSLSGRITAIENILLEKNVAARLCPDRDDMSVEKTHIQFFVPVRDGMSVDCFEVCTYSLAVRCSNG